MLGIGKKFEIMSYKSLEIYQLARKNTISIHKMSLLLPKFELYETDSQVRRSCKSVWSNIGEGYGRRRYKNEFVHILTYAIASNDEKLDHLESVFEAESLKDKFIFGELAVQTTILGKKLNNFISAVEKGHNLRIKDLGSN